VKSVVLFCRWQCVSGANGDVSRSTEESWRRECAREAGVASDGVVVLQGGKATCRNDTDHEPLFRQESFFQYLFGVKEPDCFGAVCVMRPVAFVALCAASARALRRVDGRNQVAGVVRGALRRRRVSLRRRDRAPCSASVTLRVRSTCCVASTATVAPRTPAANLTASTSSTSTTPLLFEPLVECRVVKSASTRSR
jgi:hypothetical protein